MDKEAYYATLPQAEAETRRRIFWLVFITERGSQSYLFSSLLERTQDLLEVNNIPPSLFGPQAQQDLFQEKVGMESVECHPIPEFSRAALSGYF
ncbi:hypothetical protein BDW59DRAFT_166439 [Aspergillus cavernicola]|uniref:Transcription factor domain-containing protein n=1 Tax=Aspergillus cavernicola TaxID=176166 RepID=A0ABR4HL79_9EURO